MAWGGRDRGTSNSNANATQPGSGSGRGRGSSVSVAVASTSSRSSNQVQGSGNDLRNSNSVDTLTPEEMSALNLRSQEPPPTHDADEGQRARRIRPIRRPLFDKKYCEEKFDHVVVRKPDDDDVLPSKKGTVGRPVTLVANFFPVLIPKEWYLFHYHVDFKPEQVSTKVKKQLVKQHERVLSIRGGYICDGQNIWTPYRLYQFSDPPLELLSETDTNERVLLIIKHVGEVRSDDAECIQLYNIIYRKCMALLELFQIGRNYFSLNPEHRIKFERNMDLLPGYFCTMRKFENQVLMNVDFKHKVINTQTCLDIINQFRSHDHINKEKVLNELVGSIILTGYNNQTYKVDDIDFSRTPHSTFKDRSGQDITFVQYYQSKYGCAITDSEQPLLVSLPKKKDLHRGDRQPIVLIPELCVVTGISDQTRENYSIMRRFGEVTRKSPVERMRSVVNFMHRMNASNEVRQEFMRYGLQFRGEPKEVIGRVLPAEPLTMGGKPISYENANWKNAIKNNQMSSCKKLEKNWFIVYYCKTPTQAPAISNLIRLLGRVGGRGFPIREPLTQISVQDSRPQHFASAIKEGMDQFKEKVELVVVILPEERRNDIYNLVKKTCCITYRVLSQCLLDRNVRNERPGFLMSYCTNVMMQLNTKLGGEPWLPEKSLNRTMVVGFDTYHCGKRSKRSVGAVVATMNGKLSRFYSVASFRECREEISSTMRTDIAKCASAYKELNDQLPDHVVLFRDGVGEGQLRYVFNIESDEILESLAVLYKSAKRQPPKLTIIIVCKRINARYFVNLTKPKQPIHLENPVPGTIVDDVITRPEWNDFYLVSQRAVAGGTVSPTSYNIILDQQQLAAGEWQGLAHRLTHLYYNWTGTVSVPSVCQYAHKLAYLTGTALEAPASEGLAHHLYYL